jgi:plastocyanin
MRVSRSLLAAIAVAGVAMLTAPGATAATTAQVGIADFRFSPSYIRVEPGDSVRWTQRGSVHTVTSRKGVPEPFDSGDLTTGASFTMTFLAAGRFPYHCTIHSEMRGVVQVGPDTVAPKPTRLKAKLGKSSASVSFRLAEASKVSATLAAKAKPRKVLRRAKARDLQDGKRSLSVRTSGLAGGRYRVTVKAVDPEGNVGTAVVALVVPAPRQRQRLSRRRAA